MRLSTFSDYSFRVLMYLGLKRDRLVTIAEIARVYGISENHLMKVVHQLGKSGFVETIRGKGGGMRLAREPRDILVGDVVRHTENDLCLVECFDKGADCRIRHACRLTSIMGEALESMFNVLNQYTVADLLERQDALAGALVEQAAPVA